MDFSGVHDNFLNAAFLMPYVNLLKNQGKLPFFLSHSFFVRNPLLQRITGNLLPILVGQQ
jgi:hypothetical protein